MDRVLGTMLSLAKVPQDAGSYNKPTQNEALYFLYLHTFKIDLIKVDKLIFTVTKSVT